MVNWKSRGIKLIAGLYNPVLGTSASREWNCPAQAEVLRSWGLRCVECVGGWGPRLDAGGTSLQLGC